MGRSRSRHPPIPGHDQAIKFSSKPVVVAPFGMTLGGGCEITLHAARQPHAELYTGLVELALVCCRGGGCKEMTLRASTRRISAPAGRGRASN